MFIIIIPDKRNKNKNTQIPWHLHTIQKSGSFKTRESHFSLVWVMEFFILSPWLNKVNVFHDNSNLTKLSKHQRLHENGK